MNDNPGAEAPDAVLDRMQFRADPLADDTIARIVGPWQTAPSSSTADELIACNCKHWQRLDAATRAMSQWHSNGALADWQPTTDTAIDTAADLAEVLHTTGQLEQRAEYRIRSTAAMVFPVMMAGGLTAAEGGGVAQVLKVRLIHATVRNLILRGEPQAAVAALAALTALPGEFKAGSHVLPPLEALRALPGMHCALYAHGWKLGEDGLPCNQEELAYTLLTFGFVFLRGLRTLGLRLSRSDEEAYLHTWNVVGHLLGIERELMPDTMDAAAALFTRMQARGRAPTSEPVPPDPRPALGRTLMQTLSQVIPLGVAKPLPVLMTRRLCRPATARDIGLDGPVPWLSQALFALGLLAVRVIDAVVRLAVPGFSLARFATRVLGYHLVSQLLMDQTRPLKLPEHVCARVAAMMSNWGDDPRAPGWLNRLEDRFTTRGGWNPPVR